MKGTPRAPRTLHKPGRKFWKDTHARLVIEEPHHLRLLEQAGICLDRIDEAYAQIEQDGPCVRDRFNQLREHPAMKSERDNKVLFVRILRELGLDVVQQDEYVRPRRLY